MYSLNTTDKERTRAQPWTLITGGVREWREGKGAETGEYVSGFPEGYKSHPCGLGTSPKFVETRLPRAREGHIMHGVTRQCGEQ